MNITLAQQTDYDHVLALLQHVKLLTDDLLVDGTRYWLAQNDAGEVAGCIGVELGTDAILIRSLAVYEAYRDEGLALRLINHAMDEAKSGGYQHAYCFSTRAADYFKRLGFRQVPVEQLATVLPDAPQVIRFAKIGKLAGERAWYKPLA